MDEKQNCQFPRGFSVKRAHVELELRPFVRRATRYGGSARRGVDETVHAHNYARIATSPRACAVHKRQTASTSRRRVSRQAWRSRDHRPPPLRVTSTLPSPQQRLPALKLKIPRVMRWSRSRQNIQKILSECC